MRIGEIQNVATDDRVIERAASSCSHYKCSGGPCRMYSEGTLRITDADRAKAVEMVAEGWHRTSNRYRTVVRLLQRAPELTEVCDSVFLTSIRGRLLREYYDQQLRDRVRFGEVDDLPYEEGVLSPSLFRAFVEAGGRPW